ncbi:MAG: DUF177 domain-containing protein [Acidobacteria bacterium]|nr:DUF177 domain-containing protein [Acidobacteriota bacterium]
MLIEVENLNEQGRPFDQTYAPGDLSLEDEFARLAAEARVWGRATRKRDEVHVRGQIQTSVELRCDRCLGPAPLPVNVEFAALFGQAAEASAEATELHGEDLDFSVYEGDSINLDEIVREQILLALPLRQLCRDDCKGLCMTCRADLNTQTCGCQHGEIDPRWAALKELKVSDE